MMVIMPAKGEKKTRVKFIDPPVNELVISLYHTPILELKSQHIGLYWNRIRSRFPFCDQQPVVAVTPQDMQSLMDVPGELMPLPRFWFHSDQHPTLLQVQRNAFMLNWRRVSGASGSDYPHYDGLAKDFWQEFEGYTAFLEEAFGAKIALVQRCELNYVNLVGPNEYFSKLSDIQTILPSMAGISEIAGDGRELAGLNAVISYRVDANLVVDVTVRLGRRMENNEPVLGLELKAHGVPDDLSLEGVKPWYELAHDAIHKTFLDITPKVVQNNLWKPK